MGVFPVTPASLAAQPSTSPWTWWGHGLSSVAPPAPTVPEERGRLPDPHGACGHCACARTPRGLGPRTLPGPGRPASEPARTGLGFQTRRQAAVPPPLSQDGAVATATKALARDGSRGRRTRGRRWAAEARSARRAGRREASAGARGRTDGALGPNPGAGSFPAPHTPRSSRRRGERRRMRRSRRLTRAQTLPRVRNAALDSRDFSNGPPLRAATPHAHRRGSEKVQEAGCHAREPGWLRRARRPARCTQPTSRFPGALSAPSSLRGPSRRPRRTCRRRATAAHGRRGDAPGPRQGAAGNWHTVSREDERPRPRRLRADPQQTAAEQTFRNISAKWMMTSLICSPKFSFLWVFSNPGSAVSAALSCPQNNQRTTSPGRRLSGGRGERPAWGPSSACCNSQLPGRSQQEPSGLSTPSTEEK